MKTIGKIIAYTLLAHFAFASDVEWSRLRGTVKALDFKAQRITIQNREGDLLTIQINKDVMVLLDKEPPIKKRGGGHSLVDVNIDDKVVLVNIPQEEPPKEETFEEMNAPKSR